MGNARGRELQGRIALITGAVRRIGRAIALALADEGAAVVIDTRRSQGEAEAAQRKSRRSEAGADASCRRRR